MSLYYFKYVKAYNMFESENRLVLESENTEFESNEVYDKEDDAKKYLSRNNFRSVGYVKMPEGYEHIFIEQFENANGREIARLVWLGNIKRKGAPDMSFPPDKWQLTTILPGHKNYEKAKKREL